MRQQASGTQGCKESERCIWNLPVYNEDRGTIEKALKSIHNFNTRYGVIFTNLCTPCSGTHWFSDTTHLHSYVCIHLHKRRHTCTGVHICTYWYRSGAWTYLHVYVNVCIGACTLVHVRIQPTYVHVAWDVIPDHVGHMYGFPSNPNAHVG